MYCLIKNDMKFGEHFIPARTRAKVINKPSYREVDIPGLSLYLAITFFDIELMKKDSVPLSSVSIKNEYDSRTRDSTMVGITVLTVGTEVLMDAGDDFYTDATISEHQVKKVLGVEDIPKGIKKAQYMSRPYLVRSLVEYLEEDFSKWVNDNCEFYIYTEEDIENGDCFSDAEVGDRTLSEAGLRMFEDKKVEYLNKIEQIGFTYDFKGGLIWD